MRHPHRLQLTRRDWLRLAAFGVTGSTCSGWLDLLADDAKVGGSPNQRRACIVLWMGGGPSQLDTFDLKPGHANGGPFREIETSAAGVKLSEHLPQLAKWGDRLAVVRSMTTKEGDHARGTQVMHTGYAPQGPIQFPPLGSLIAKELADAESDLPNCVSIAPNRNVERTLIGGFLGANYAPLAIGGGERMAVTDPARALQIADVKPSSSITTEQLDARLAMLGQLDRDFLEGLGGAESSHPSSELTRAHRSAYEKAVRLMRTDAALAFDLDRESPSLRDAYGRTLFGQGCLLARRLIERGVPFVEVNLSNTGDDNNSWDTHQTNFDRVRRLSEILDPAWSTLLRDLDERGLLDTTTIVWMGEFGRTPDHPADLRDKAGRDHNTKAMTMFFAGGGAKPGVSVGTTDELGWRAVEKVYRMRDVHATILHLMGLNDMRLMHYHAGRNMRLTDTGGEIIRDAVA